MATPSAISSEQSSLLIINWSENIGTRHAPHTNSVAATSQHRLRAPDIASAVHHPGRVRGTRQLGQQSARHACSDSERAGTSSDGVEEARGPRQDKCNRRRRLQSARTWRRQWRRPKPPSEYDQAAASSDPCVPVQSAPSAQIDRSCA